MATTPNLLLSPTSTASYDIVSSPSGSLSDRSDVTSDDEVVWLPRGSSESPYEGSIISDTDDDDFVVLSRARSPLRNVIRTSSNIFSGHDEELSSAISGLSLGQTYASHRPARGIGVDRPSSAATLKKASVRKPSQQSPLGGGLSQSQKKKKEKKKAQKKATKERGTVRGGLATPAFPIIDDSASETGSASTTSTVSGYEDAASFITSFLSSPESKDSFCKLTLLHSLIIELGISTSPLPQSLRAAKALLKSQAHVNIKEYVIVREQGQDALRKVMHPSHNALVKDIRKKGHRASLKWVKSQGLQVLLVNCFH